MNQLAPFRPALSLPALVAADERAQVRFLELFTLTIRNPNTRRAYARAASEFLAALDNVPASGGLRKRRQ